MIQLERKRVEIKESGEWEGLDVFDNGVPGKGISFIEKTDTQGAIDTYTINYTNGDTSTYTVKNGEAYYYQFEINDNGHLTMTTIENNTGPQFAINEQGHLIMFTN